MLGKLVPSSMRRIIGVDLGTTNSVIVMEGKVVASHPTMLAYNKATNVWCFGKEAAALERLHSDHIEIIKPMVDGKITEFKHIEKFLCFLIANTCPNWAKYYAKILKTRMLGSVSEMKVIKQSIELIVIAIPCQLTDPHINAVRSIGEELAQRCVLVLQPVASACNEIDFNVYPVVKIVDIGGGTTDLAAACATGVIGRTKSLAVAGNAMDLAIKSHIKKRDQVEITEYRARMIKHQVGAAQNSDNPCVVEFEGRDATGAKKEISYSSENSVEALEICIKPIVDATLEFMANLAQERPDATTFTKESDQPRKDEIKRPRETDLLFLTGGQSQLANLADRFRVDIKCIVLVAQDPLHSAAIGAWKLAQDEIRLKNFEVTKSNNGIEAKIQDAEVTYTANKVVPIDGARNPKATQEEVA